MSLKPDMGFSKGQNVLVETSNGYKWPAEVVEYRRESYGPNIPDKHDEHALLLDMPKHPAREPPHRIGRGYIDIEREEVNTPPSNKKYDVEQVWVAQDI